MVAKDQLPNAAQIAKNVLLFRGERVMLDRDLANLYGVKTIALRQQVRRNIERFPNDFMFQLDREEAQTLVSQNVIPSLQSLGGSLPFVFTQEGVAMLSSVLNSNRAVQVNIAIMRAFVKMRQMLLAHSELSHKIKELEGKFGKHDKEIAMIVATKLYEQGKLSLGQAAELVGLTKRTFSELLGKFNVSIFNYPASDIPRDVRNA